MVLLTVALASCKSTMNLAETPAVETTDLVRDGGQNGGDTTTIANIPWKEFFTDTQLQNLIGEGLGNNRDLQIALTRISQAEATFSMSRAALQPSLSAAAQVSHTRTSSDNGDSKLLGYYTNVTSLGFNASWEIDLWGKLNYQSKARYAGLLNSYAYRNLVQTSLVANIAKGYYNLLALDEQLQITQQTILLLQKSAETMAQLKEAGQQTEAAVEQSNALLYNTQLSVPQLESLIRKQENALCQLLGRNPGPIDRNRLNSQTIPTRLDYGVPLQLLAKRPDVKQAELSFRSAWALTKVAEASFYPSLNISSVRIGVAGGALADLFKPESIAADLVAGLAQPIFAKRQLRGNLQIAQAQQKEALLNFQNTVFAAGQEVSDILFSFQSSLNKNQFREKQVKSLTNAVDYTRELLVAGEANYTEVLSAQQNLLSAQLGQVNDMLEQLTYSVSLYKALGGGTN